MKLTVQYTAPLPPGFLSGSITLTSQTQYVDKDGLVNQPYYKATINADRTLTDVQSGQPLQIVGMGQGDPATASPLTVVATLNATNLPTPLRPTSTIIPLNTAAAGLAGALNLHLPAINVPAVGPLPATIQALIDQATATQAQLDGTLSTVQLGLSLIPPAVQAAQTATQNALNVAAILPAPPVKDALARDAYFASKVGDCSCTQMDLQPPHVWQRLGGIVSDLGPATLASPSDKPLLRPQEISAVSKPPRRPMVMLRFDDGFPDDYDTVRPLLAAKGVKATFGIILSYIGQTVATVPYMDRTRILQLQSDGHEIASHTTNHDDQTTLSYDVLDAGLKANLSAMQAQGYNVSTLIYPYNANNAQVRTVARKYFRCAFAGGYASAVPPINTYSLPFREFVQGSPLSLYQGWVDDAVAKNGVCCILIHSRFAEFDAPQQQNLKDLIDYAVAQGCQFVTASQMMDVFGNQAEWGDYAGGVTGGGYDRDGKYFANGGGLSQQAIPNFKTAAAGLQDFDAGRITVFDVNPQPGANWPGSGAGTVTVNRLASATGHLSTPGGGNYGWEFEEFRDYYTGVITQRIATGPSTWTTWSNSEAVVIRLQQNGGNPALSASSPRTAFTSGKISTFTATGNGWPYRACTVVVDRSAGGDASGNNTMWDRQIVYDFDSENFSIRRATSDTLWSGWTEETSKTVDLGQNPPGIDGTSGRTAFAAGKTTSLTFYGGLAKGWPCDVGTAVTVRAQASTTTGGNTQWDRQEIFDYASDAKWQRRATSDTAWTNPVRTDAGGAVQVSPAIQDTTYRASTPITGYPLNKLIYTQLLPQQITDDITNNGGVYPPGASTSGGTLVAETLTTANGSARSWSKRFWWQNGSSTIWYQGLNYDGTTLSWGTWYQIPKQALQTTQNVAIGVVPAGGQVGVEVAVAGVQPGDFIDAVRVQDWYPGLFLITAACYTAGKIKLYVRNFTTADINDSSAQPWNFRATR